MRLANIQCVGCRSVHAEVEASETAPQHDRARGLHRCALCGVAMQTFPVTCDKCGAALGWLTFPAERDVGAERLRGHLCDADAGIVAPPPPPTPPKDKARG